MERALALRQDHLVLGRYRPLRPLGSGGSGSVWLVRDEESAREVALKVVPREGQAGSRAEREVEAAAERRADDSTAGQDGGDVIDLESRG